MKNNKIGVITEQGFVIGEGLGFKPVKGKELCNNEKHKKLENKKEKEAKK